jgi:hypothetical protein
LYALKILCSSAAFVFLKHSPENKEHKRKPITIQEVYLFCGLGSLLASMPSYAGLLVSLHDVITAPIA